MSRFVRCACIIAMLVPMSVLADGDDKPKKSDAAKTPEKSVKRKKKKKTPRINLAIGKAHRILDRLAEDVLDEAARLTVTESKVLDGVYSCKFKLVKINRGDDGTLELHGKLIAKRGDDDHYRTAAERNDMQALKDQLDEENLNHRRTMKEKTIALRDAQKDTHIGRRIKRSIREEKRRHADAVKAIKKTQRERGREINEAADARRKECESIDVIVRLTESAQEKTDLAKLLEQTGKVTIRCKITEFTLAREPQEIGGRPRISALQCLANKISW